MQFRSPILLILLLSSRCLLTNASRSFARMSLSGPSSSISSSSLSSSSIGAGFKRRLVADGGASEYDGRERLREVAAAEVDAEAGGML